MRVTSRPIGHAPNEVRHLAIVIATMRRPDGLRELFESILPAQHVLAGECRVDVVVCDNDPAGSAKQTTDEFEARFTGAGVHYVLEPRRGIPFARNTSIAVALALGADAVVFVDDDETVDVAWLRELVNAQARYGAHVVTGPVLPVYGNDLPAWVRQGGFFDRPRRINGAHLQSAATNNTLTVRAVFDAVDGFDARFAMSGGSDHHFFVRAHLAGAVMVAVNEAIVYERIPPSRARIAWLMRRAYRLQAGYVYCEREFLPLKSWAPARIAKTVAIAARGFVRIGAGVVLGHVTLVRGLQDVARAAGAIGGVAGRLLGEYRTIHGS